MATTSCGDQTLNAVQEARDCEVPIDGLTNDPRDVLTAIGGIPADTQLRAARDAPRLVAHDLAAAHVASPANRAAVEAARSAHVVAQLRDKPTPDDPVFAAYLDYLGDDPAFSAYLVALDGINAASSLSVTISARLGLTLSRASSLLPMSETAQAACSFFMKPIWLRTKYIDLPWSPILTASESQ